MLPNEKFAIERRKYYDEIGLVVDKTNGQFAHYPYPKGMGETGGYLLFEDHQQQGILQSKDVGRMCFFGGHAKQWLLNCDPLPPNYFELWDIYETYITAHNKEYGGETLKQYVKDNPEHQSWAGEQCHKNLTSEQIKENGRRAYMSTGEDVMRKGRLLGAPFGGQKVKEMGVGICNPEYKERFDIMRRMNNKTLFRCTLTGKVSTAPALAKYQKNRGIDTTCRERLPEHEQPYNKTDTINNERT